MHWNRLAHPSRLVLSCRPQSVAAKPVRHLGHPLADSFLGPVIWTAPDFLDRERTR